MYLVVASYVAAIVRFLRLFTKAHPRGVVGVWLGLIAPGLVIDATQKQYTVGEPCVVSGVNGHMGYIQLLPNDLICLP